MPAQTPTSSTLAGIFERPGVMQPLSPQRMANPLLSGAALEARWAELQPERGAFDWTYFERSLALLAIANKRAVLSVVGPPPDWVTLDEAESAWDDFVHAFGARFAGEPRVAAVAITRSFRPKPKPSQGETPYQDALEMASLFDDAFPGIPLTFYAVLPPAVDGANRIAMAIDALRSKLGARLALVALDITGDRDSLERLRPAGEAIRAARGTIQVGVRLAPRIAGGAAESRPASAPSNAPTGAPTDASAERFRRALAFGLWLGASYFEIDGADAADLGARPDLLYLREQLARLYNLPAPFVGGK
ncbi:MAG: hypothetical protein NTW86_30600 [Candidatus Sumerlaeota bacterium]|nr:hypothetical protein [Candidatus Sumerlaeota bacterium]